MKLYTNCQAVAICGASLVLSGHSALTGEGARPHAQKKHTPLHIPLNGAEVIGGTAPAAAWLVPVTLQPASELPPLAPDASDEGSEGDVSA